MTGREAGAPTKSQRERDLAAELRVATRGVTTGEDAETALEQRFGDHQGIDAAVNLFDAGLIDYDEMISLMQWTDPNDDQNEVYGLAAGEFKISKRDMKKADPTLNLDAVNETMKGHSEWWKNTVAPVGNVMTALNPAAAGGRAAWGMGAWAVDWIEGAEESAIEGKAAISEGRERLTSMIQDLPPEALSERERETMLTKARTGMWPPVEVIERLQEPGFEDLSAELAEIGALVETDEGPIAAPTPHEYLPAEERAELEAQRGMFQQVEGTEGVQLGNIVAAPRTFAQYVAQSGLIPADEQGIPIDTGVLTAGIDDPRSEAVDSEYWYDKASGAYLSREQYQSVREGAARAALRYAPDVGYGRIQQYYELQNAPLTPEAQRVKASYQSLFSYGDEATGAGGAGAPVSISSLVPGGITDGWRREAYHWQPGQATSWLNSLSTEQKSRWTDSLKERGLLDIQDQEGNTYFSAANQEWYIREVTEQTLGVSRGEQVSPWEAVPLLGQFHQDQLSMRRAEVAHLKAMANAMTPKKLPFSVPRSLRSIPDMREISTSVKEDFTIKLGRAPTETELASLSDNLQGYHRTSQQQQIDLAYAQWGSEGDNPDDFDITEGIQNPGLVSQYDIENKWANEINLNERQETNARSFNRIMSATGGNLTSTGGTPTTGENIVRT